MEQTLSDEEAKDHTKSRSKKSKKSFIKSEVNLHDQTQVEAVFDYKLELEDPGTFALLEKQNFEVELFLFFPPQMGVNAQNYARSQFYEDLRPLLRLKEPRYSYKDFLGTSKRAIQSPLLFVESYLTQRVSGHKGKDLIASEDVIDQARLFACTFSSYFHKRVQRRCQRFQRLHEAAEVDEDTATELFASCQVLFERGHHLLQLWRNLSAQADALTSGVVPGELVTELRLAGEYCHYRFREGLALIAAEVGQLPRAVQGYDTVVAFKYRLKVWTRYQRRLAHQHGFYWIERTSDLELQEKFIFRRSHLKKHMWQVLYLEMKPRTSLIWRRQMGYMLAAGFAAGWALMANLLILYKFQFGGFSSFASAESLMGYSGMGIILAFILAYVLKDRIKDLGKDRLKRGLFGKLPDFSEKVWSRSSAGKMRSIGYVQESMNFFKSPEQVPRQVRQVRASLPTVDLIEREKVVHYHKRIALDKGSLRKFDQPMSAVRDIIRFSVRRFLGKLDDPLQKYLSIDTRGEAVTLLIPKVYHLDLVLHYSYQDAFGKMIHTAFDCRRLVLNKEGLVRIERPLPNDEPQ